MEIARRAQRQGRRCASRRLTWDELPQCGSGHCEEEIAERAATRTRTGEDAETISNPDVRTLALDQDRHYKFQSTSLQRTIRNIEAEFYLRPALACGCLLFALLGCPVGIWANRADYLSTFVICFIPRSSFTTRSSSAAVARPRRQSAARDCGCWLANIVIGVIAVVLNARLLRR